MDRHQSDLAGSAAPIASAVRRRRVESTLAEIAIWTAADMVVSRSSCAEEPAAGMVLLDDARGTPIREDDDAAVHDEAAVLDCEIVEWGLGLSSSAVECSDLSNEGRFTKFNSNQQQNPSSGTSPLTTPR